jgi:hypothetical protein
MSKRLSCARAAAALLAAGLLAAAAHARPPDLPVNYYDTFTPAGESFGSDGPAGTYEAPTAGCEGCPCQSDVVEDLWALIQSQVFGINGADDAQAGMGTAEAVQRLVAARHLYQAGRRCLGKHNLDMAYNCFREVHLLAPLSRYDRRAVEYMKQIEAVQSPDNSAEEQEPAAGGPADDPDDATCRAISARQLYRIGERCRRCGDLDMAANCYREAASLHPDSPCAGRCLERLAQIEMRRSTDETAEPCEEQDAAPDRSRDSGAACPQGNCPCLKPVKKRSCGAVLPMPREVIKVRKFRLLIIESRSATGNEQGPQDNSPSRPLHVSPTAGPLQIEQDYPRASDE